MSEASLQSLLAIRKACAELKPEVAPAARARLDQVTTLLSKLIADERALPALLQAVQQQRAELARGTHELARGTQSAPVKFLAQIEGAYARDCDAAIAAEIRSGEALAQGEAATNEVFDKTAFRHYLISVLGEAPTLEIVDVRLASRGFSKKTILVELRNNKVLPAAVALRIDRAFNFLGTAVTDEFAPLAALHAAGIRLPKPWALEATGKVLGGAFIIFEKVAGGLIGNNFQSPARNEILAVDVAHCLAQLHGTTGSMLPTLRGHDLSCEDQARYEIEKSANDYTQLQISVPLMDAAFAWLREHADWAAGERAIVHGDYNFNNLLIDGNRLAAIVDWEFLHIGNAAADLGWFHYGAEGICGWEKFLSLYEASGGRHFTKRQLDFHILLGQTRLAVMTLQTDVGFAQGKFDDVKFGLSGALYTNKSLMRISDMLQRIS